MIKNISNIQDYMPSFFQHLAWIPLRIFMILFCSVKIQGIENIENIESNLIIASNHSSELDPLIIVASLPFNSSHLPLIFVSREKSFYSKSRFGFLYGGLFFRLMGAYPAYAGLNNYDEALKNHIEAIDQGKDICIFPIGKKHHKYDTKDAKSGVIYLADTKDLPIVPVLIDGLDNLKLKDYLTRKCKLVITLGEPLFAKDLIDKNNRDYEKASVKLMDHISELNLS